MQLLRLLRAQGIEPVTEPPADLHSQFHEAWDGLTEDRRQEFIREWAWLDTQPRWQDSVKVVI